jgi:hypothetical protein
MVSASQWINSSDAILCHLADALINRKLPKVELRKTPFPESRITEILKKISNIYQIDMKDSSFLLSSEKLSNSAYSLNDNNINIVYDNHEMKDIAEVSDILNISNINQPSTKFFLSYPKDCV